MKTSLLLLSGWLGVVGVAAQTPEPQEKLETGRMSIAAQRLTLSPSPTINQIISGGFIYSGIMVQLIRADNPLQLINPAAPARYGYAEQNLSRDLITGRANGLRLFSVRF